MIKVGTVVNLKDAATAQAWLKQECYSDDEITAEVIAETLRLSFVVIAHDEGSGCPWRLMCVDNDGDDTAYWLDYSWVEQNTELKASDSIGFGERCF